MDEAREAITKALAEIELQTKKSIYLHRTLKRFYELWQLVIGMEGFEVVIEKYQHLSAYKELSDEYGKTWHECVFLMQLVNAIEVKKYLESLGECSLCDYNFLCDFQYIFSQLQILFHEYADSPGGLSSKQICGTLMRFGFPPTGNIAARISRMKEELDAEEGQCSVDSECSLCTGTVLSCLVLAREDDEIIKRVKAWLEKLDYCRFVYENKERYPGVDPTEHGLHYAAPVLDAFVDCGDSENSGRVLQHYFGSEAGGKDGFCDKWMMYRNISSVETCAYIFSALHRYLINGSDDFPFDETRVSFLRTAIVNLVDVLKRETAPNSSPSRLYATRENIQAFCLGLLIGEEESTIDLLKELMRNLHTRAIMIRKHDGSKHSFKRSLMDSNVDRTTRFIEGWIAYWETMFYLVTDAPRFGANGTPLRKTVKELKEKDYLPNYNLELGG